MSRFASAIRTDPVHPDGLATAAPAIDGYRIRRIMGEGRAAVVYLAEDGQRGGQVALKVLKHSRAGTDASRRRFAAECAIHSAIRHEHVVRVVGERAHGEPAWLALEYVEGGTLRDRMRSPIGIDEAVFLLGQAASGLAAAHRNAIVHRDVKPENFLTRSRGALALADFGVAARRGNEQARVAAGRLVGTPCYVAPEQTQGALPDTTADVYSLGVVFYEMLCGHPPFAGKSALEVLAQHLMAPVPRMPGPLASWQPLIDRMLDKRPQRRPVDADAVLKEIGGCLGPGAAPEPTE
jgi:serine/threonine protein kinase